MEKKIKIVPIYDNVQVGEREIEVFVASDGTEFDFEKACELHEKKLSAIKAAEGLYWKCDVGVIEDILFYEFSNGSNIAPKGVYGFQFKRYDLWNILAAIQAESGIYYSLKEYDMEFPQGTKVFAFVGIINP